MRGPTYSVTTGVLVALSGVAAVRLIFEGQIPPPNPDITTWGGGEFVARAETQDVAWRKLDKKAFDEAQQLSRPVIVVVGVPWSAVGRQADDAFATPEVARALNRGFIPIRVDGSQDPRWLSQFLPLHRTQTGFSIGFQAWVFDLKGRLIDFVGRSQASDVLNGPSTFNALVVAQKKFADAALSETVPEYEARQREDVARLLMPPPKDFSLEALPLEGYAEALATGFNPTWGGWELRGLIFARPLAVRFLQLAGEWEGADDNLRRAALSPRADWLDGGFYRLARVDNRTPEYDKPTVTNAQYAEALAIQDAARPNPLLRRVARRTVDWLLSLRDEVHLVPGAEAGDEDERGRSGRASFSPRRLRDAVAAKILTPQARAWAEDGLGLASGPRTAVPNANSVDDPRLDDILAALRRAAGPARTRVAADHCDVNGAVAASLLRCARLWGDRDLALSAGEMVDSLGLFRTRRGVCHFLPTNDDQPLLLSDALAYADASLEDFLTHGRVLSLQRGAEVLREAVATFGDSATGALLPSRPADTLLPRMAALPQITDDEREADSALALRLLQSYATVLGASGGDLSASATRLGAWLGSKVEASPSMGGSLAALARRLDSRAAFVVGMDAAARAASLGPRFPNRLIVPVLGPARPELKSRPPGLYLVTPKGIEGPLTEAQLAARLPARMELDG